jgi:hypothetical protein
MLHLAMQLHGYELGLIVLGTVLQSAVAFRIWQAGLAKEHASLLRFCIGAVATTIAGVLALRFTSEQVYCYVYWVSQFVVDGFALAVMLEIFRDIFKPYEALRHLGTIMFRWILAVMVLVSVVSAVSTGSIRLSELMYSISMMFDRGIMILQCGIVLFMLLTNRAIGISFTQRVFGIAVGFGLNASASLLALSVAHWIPSNMVQPVGAAMGICGCLSEAIWLTYFFIPQPERRISDVAPESRRWEYALASIQSPAPEGMFLTSIDRTVEKLLVKNNVATQGKPKEERHWFGD